MPLYTPCSCRILSTGARVWSQLMRAYVVTPSSTPIQCVLHPQVVPAGPNSPTFFPSYTQPIHLTDDSIWVLRFPYVICFFLLNKISILNDLDLFIMMVKKLYIDHKMKKI